MRLGKSWKVARTEPRLISYAPDIGIPNSNGTVQVLLYGAENSHSVEK